MRNFQIGHIRLKRFIGMLLVVVAIVLAFIAGAILKPLSDDLRISSARNTATFKSIAARTNTYSHDQQAALGVIASDTDVQHTCFQYPAANNESYSLWCGSLVSKAITVKPDAQYITDLLKKLDPVVEREAMHITTAAGTNISYDAIVYEAKTSGPYDSLTCTTSVTYFPNGNTPPSNTKSRDATL